MSLKAKNYMCFDGPEGFDEIKRSNIIIGRNNSGKSRLIEIVEWATRSEFSPEPIKRRKNRDPELIIVSHLDQKSLGSKMQSTNVKSALIIKKKFKYSIIGTEVKSVTYEDDQGIHENVLNVVKSVIAEKVSPLSGMAFCKIAAERDIVSEQAASSKADAMGPQSNGVGYTQMVEKIINSDRWNSDLIEKELLQYLNEVFSPDINFSSISAQKNEHDYWSVYLREKGKEKVKLSEWGSGIKTVLLVLSSIIVAPKFAKIKMNEFVLAIEEPENNLHPALLRKLVGIVDRLSREMGFIYFITTHSASIIDIFSGNDEAQIVHVTAGSDGSKCEIAKTHSRSSAILDDIGVRASDILLSNGVIWVEGPSDRIYVNKWLEICSNGRYQEGIHYQILFYGGKILSHFSGDQAGDAINVMKLNRNAYIIMDSDKNSDDSDLNATKKRVIAEFDNSNNRSWVTDGREIENYIPHQILEELYPGFPRLDKFTRIHGEVQRMADGSVKKVELAQAVSRRFDVRVMSTQLDWRSKISELNQEIKRWNGLS